MKSRGFTLTELLVVVAIIGLLTALAMAAFGRAQRKGHDAHRMEDVKSIQNALALYDAQNNLFPISVAPTVLDGSDSVSTALVSTQTLPKIPLDPMYPTYAYTYQSNAVGNGYTISFCLETDTIPGYAQGCGNTLTP